MHVLPSEILFDLGCWLSHTGFFLPRFLLFKRLNMDVNCCHCFNAISQNTPSVKCDGCQLKIHVRCLNISNKEAEIFTRNHSLNIKLFCNRCNVTVAAVSELKTLVSDLKASFENRLSQLESLIITKNSTTNNEEIINESVERSLRASNVILYNVQENPAVHEVDIANDILEIIDPSLVVLPENVSRIGKAMENKTRPLKLRLKSAEMARLCLKKQSALLKNGRYDKIKIKDDRTPRQQQFLKSLQTELTERTAAGETDLTIKYVHNVPQIITKQKN